MSSISTTAYSQCVPFPKSYGCHPLHSGLSYGFNDIDKDGIPELCYGDRKESTIINKWDNNVYLKIGVIPFEYWYTQGRGIEFHDFNNDGENELVTFTAGGIGVSSKNSLNGYSAPIFQLWTNGSYVRDQVVVDCNNDGFKEIYGIDASRKRLYILKNINGVLGGIDSIQLLGTLKYMAFGDINFDGFNDIMVSADGTNTGFNIIRGGASGYTTSFYNASGVNYRFNIGDLNGDNFPEIVCQQNTSKVAILIFQNNGGANFTALPLIQLSQDIPTVDADVIITDFDIDQLL